MAILIGLEPEMMLRLLALSLFLVPGVPGAAWGGKGHRIIASASVRGLPRVVGAWFSGQEGMVVEHASDPDHWRRDRKEPPRHFINSDVYGGPSSVPLTPDEAIDQIGARRFQKTGQLPWTVQDQVRSLASAFRDRDRGRVLLETSYLSTTWGISMSPSTPSATMTARIRDSGEFTRAGKPVWWSATWSPPP